MVPPPPRFPLPFTLHLLLVPCIGVGGGGDEPESQRVAALSWKAPAELAGEARSPGASVVFPSLPGPLALGFWPQAPLGECLQ